YKAPRRNLPYFRMEPTGTNLHYIPASCLQVPMGLIAKCEFLSVQGPPKGGFEGNFFYNFSVHFGRKERKALPSLCFGLIHGCISAAQKPLQIQSIVGVECDADAEAGINLFPLYLERRS